MPQLCAVITLTDCLGEIPPPPPIASTTLIVTHYDPAAAGVNCDADCSVLADNLPWSYDDPIAACIMDWFYQWVTIDGLGTFHCRDTGGGIVREWDEDLGMWIIRIDILDPAPGWDWLLIGPGEWRLGR